MSSSILKMAKFSLEERRWITGDGVSISTNFLKAKSKVRRLIVLCPGFAKYKDAYPMVELMEHLAVWGDVISVDFRGIGKSGGRYHFGGSEHQDLEPILKWARPRYRKVILLGLSLGSYHSLRAAHAWPWLVDKLLLVSCPTRLEDVLLTLGPLRQAFVIITHWKAFKKRLGIEFTIFFRWGNPFSKKPDASILAPELTTPVAFLVGGRDKLVVKSLSRQIYEKANTLKTWTEIPDGNHAEFLFLENTKKFKTWVQKSLK
jgi:pimeloyl-ACP methyl ester carboxylesterase